MLEVVKVLKLALFSVRSLKSLTPLSSKFSLGPQYFQDFDNTGTKGGIIAKYEEIPAVLN